MLEIKVPAWKCEALCCLPNSFAGTRAALLILELPDERGADWPAQSPALIAGAALRESQECLRRLLQDPPPA
jgi:hypothetical protein